MGLMGAILPRITRERIAFCKERYNSSIRLALTVVFSDGKGFYPKSKWAREESDQLVYAAIYDADSFYCVLVDKDKAMCYNGRPDTLQYPSVTKV
jgi:hypothetical protein